MLYASNVSDVPQLSRISSRFNKRLDLGVVSQVTGNRLEGALDRKVIRFLGRLVETVLVNVGRNRRQAVCRQDERRCTADPRGRAGYDCHVLPRKPWIIEVMDRFGSDLGWFNTVVSVGFPAHATRETAGIWFKRKVDM